MSFTGPPPKALINANSRSRAVQCKQKLEKIPWQARTPFYLPMYQYPSPNPPVRITPTKIVDRFALTIYPYSLGVMLSSAP
jgi:hypothetical protein